MFRIALGKRLATTDGSIAVDGLIDTVQIGRDRFGVAYIDAKNDLDAWFGLGFCHGQDRAFQMEGLLRATRGTLAELVGVDALPIDRLSRRIGFHRSAVAQFDSLDKDVAGILDAYARGAYQGATRGGKKLAHEFTLLRSEPSPYEPADVLALMKLMAFLLASNWDSELVRYKMLTQDGPDAVTALDPTYPDWLPATVPPGKPAGPATDNLLSDLEFFGKVVGLGGGSNNWAISGSRTDSGRPIVANDPHLQPSHPSHWYLARVSTPQWSVVGASLVGAPGAPVGFNGHCAWGVTAGLTDNTDLFLTDISADGSSVRVGEDLVRCETITETIKVKGGEDVVEQVLITPQGPVIGPALDDTEASIAMRAVWLDARPVSGLLTTHKATSVHEIKESYRDWPGLPLNIVSADTTGDIAWQLVGEAPVRKKGYGTIPMPGWDPEVGWEDGTLSVDELPGQVNPECGFLATANNKPLQGDDGPFISHDFIDGYRVARITEKLAEREDWTLESAGRLQMDLTPIPWREMKTAIVECGATNPNAMLAIEMLETWDGVASSGSSPGTVYELFVVAMAQRAVRAKAPQTAEWALGRGMSALTPESILFTRRTGHLSKLMAEKPDGWFDAGWDTEIEEALAAVVQRLIDDYGSDTGGWAWGTVRPLSFVHPVGERKPMDKVFNLGPFPWGGDANTVSQAAVSFLDPTENSPFVASMRMVVDVGEWEDNRFVLPGGQSGNPMSPHYSDQLDLYRFGGAVSIAWSDEARDMVVRETLVLEKETDDR
ncbi:MAG: penicillin acylase family protein [Actinomycetia bacterium]|nr:penicillin acylase family protein [Actinomycetes bacterium]